MLYFTIPDVRKDYWKNYYALRCVSVDWQFWLREESPSFDLVIWSCAA